MFPPFLKRFAALGFCLALAACGAPPPRETPAPPVMEEQSLYRSLSRKGAEVDAQAARDMISQYRRNHGLGELTLDAGLEAEARGRAEAMARRGASPTDGGARIENLSAGYDTLAEVFSGWRQSPAHNARMLSPRARRMGIAAIQAPSSKFRVFWALELGE
ncbi:MAG: CAP domain-containing protein [Methylocystis sp.]